MVDEWEDTVAAYCLSLGLQFGFQIFARSRKAPEGDDEARWYPSTVFLVTHTLTAALRDVASRSDIAAAPGTPPGLAGLACAVRNLHGTIFQPYGTWLKAARLRPPSRPHPPRPNQDSLHYELGDLALYWLVHAEAANLRHTPEMLWFIFFCGQRSWQAKQVLGHIRLHRDALADLSKQPWLAALGPGLLRAVQALHDRYRRTLAGCLGGDCGEGEGACGGEGLLYVEATLRITGSDCKARDDASAAADADLSVVQVYGASASAAAAAATDAADVNGGVLSHEALRVTVMADGSASVPYTSVPYDKAYGVGSRWGSYLDGSYGGDDARSDCDKGAGAGAAGARGGVAGGLRPPPAAATPAGRRPGGVLDSPCLPLPPSISTPAPSASAPGAVSSAFAAPGAAAAVAAAAAVSAAVLPSQQRHQQYSQLSAIGSTPKSPVWDPRVAADGYRELLLRLCPNEATVALALAADGGCGGDAEDGSGKQAGTQFLERVVQPLFLFLTEQVYELGQARRQGLEAAVRIGYDDVSESMAHPRIVAAALAALPWATTTAATVGVSTAAAAATGPDGVRQRAPQQGREVQQQQQQQLRQGKQQQQFMPRAASHDEELYWSRLLALSDLLPSGSARIPWQGDMACHRKQLLQLLQGEGGGAGTTRGGGGGGNAVGGGGNAVGGGNAATDSGQAAASAPRKRLGPPGPQLLSTGRGSSSVPSLDGEGGEEGDEEAPNPTVEQMAQAAALAAAQPPEPEAASEVGRLRAANAAADWWSRHVLRKTFAEHRSVAMPLVAFSRVFQFQLLWFYLLAVWSWTGDGNRMHWIASAAALHWGSNCLLWSMQAVLSAGPRMKRGGVVIPAYDTRQGQPKRGSGPAAPYNLYGLQYHIVHIYLLSLAWAALGAGLYIAYIVWPNHNFYGHQCYPLFWERSCYWWIAVLYGGTLVLYELLYRQLNFGGYVRGHVYDIFLWLVPSQGTASASSSYNPLYDPSKHLRTGLSYLLGNAALWATTLGLKFVVDYFVIVRPAGPQLREVMATDRLAWSFHIPSGWGWWPMGWSRHFTVDLDPCMAAAQVIVLFLLSLVSSGVAYTVVTAIWGAMQGVYQGVGSIRHWGHIRSGFHRVQAAMRAKLLTSRNSRAGEPQAAEEGDAWRRSWSRRAAAGVYRAVGAVLLLPVWAVVWVLRALCCLPPPASDRPRSWVEREATLGLTAPFWNAIVRSMRGRDLLSDREAAALSFTSVCLSPAAMMATWRRGGGSALGSTTGGDTLGRGRLGSDGSWLPGGRETYLPPVAVYVAQLPQLVISGSRPTAEQLEQLQEAYLYLLHLLVAVGAIPRSPQAAAAAAGCSTGTNGVPLRGGSSGDASTSSSSTATAAAAASSPVCPDLHKDSFHPDKFVRMAPRAWTHRGLVGRRELLGAVVALVRALVETGKVYKDTSAAAAAGGSAAVSSRSRAIDRLCMALHAVARCAAQMRDMPWEVGMIMNRVVARQHYHQPAVKAQLHRGFATLVEPNRQNASTWGAEHMPSYDDFAKVSSWLLAILRPTDEGTTPANSEAVSLLADFCSGLLHPGLPAAPRVAAMRSVSTLIPHYQETVLYALSSADAARVLREAGATSLEGRLADDEVLFKNDEGAPSELLQYLVSEFPDEFRNLLERCRTLVPLGKDDPPYILEDFLPIGRLYAHRAQLLLWASCRGQVLARTVDGMHMYRTALAMQAVHDAMMEAGGGAANGRSGGQGPPRQQQQQQQGGSGGGVDGAGAGGGDAGGRLKLSGVQRMLVQGILKDESLAVEELVAQLIDVVPELGPLLDRKYGLVVSSQVFSKMAASRSLSDRWRAHGIALLATRYSAVRVAYLEQDGDPITLFKAPDFTYRVVHQASMLVRAVPLEREVEARRKARAEKRAAAAAAAKAAAIAIDPAAQGAGCSPAITAMYGTGYDGGAAVAATLSPRPVTPPASWIDALSVTCDGASEDGSSSEGEEGSGGDGDGGDEGDGGKDAGAALRVWRRRFHLKHLRAAELQVLFRQRLPINYYDRNAAGVGVILGEGKPENQNSAVPYCPGVLLQTIDMNQDNSLAQALKLRNATREFEPLGPGRERQHVAVVGYPEWIFSYRCGLLADLAAATERTFGTQIQRVMAYPSAVRAHYGHPDLWNRLFAMTRGGVSKANAVQHVSEDVFGGYNALKRGGLSKYVSYISVGKGRDMGLDSILGFEGKISKGCAEQLMSRDLRFLGAHTDFFRSMSLYFTVPGHFINTWLTVVTIQLGVWVQLLLLLGGVGKTGSSVASAVGAVQVLQLGTMPLLGFLFNLWLESGMATALATIARQFIGGGLLFHIFRSVTSAFHLGRAVLFGGASYVATGRGFSLRRRTFTQVYVNYGRSHLYLGADILLMVVLILVVGNNGGNKMPVPAAAMWSPILVAVALLAGPFWFTPFFFRLNQVLRDTREFRTWVSSGSAARGVAESWPEWNASQLAALRNDGGGQVARYRFWSGLALLAPRAAICTLSAVTAVTGARFDTARVPDLVWVLGGSGGAWLLAAALTMTRRAYLSSGLAVGWRWAKGVVQVVALAAGAALAAVCLFMDKKGLRFSGVLITLYANYSVASLFVCFLVVWMPKSILARSMSNLAYRHVDAVLGTVLSAVLIVICFISEIGIVMLDRIQTLVQFNDRYSHTQAAKPYGGEDDVAAGGGGGSGGPGGGGLTAAAAAALRRRLPSHLALMATPMTPRGGGGGSRRVTAGGASAQQTVSRPPSATQGWVSPRFRDGGGTSPFTSFTAGNNTSASAVVAAQGRSPSTTGVVSPAADIGGSGAATLRSSADPTVHRYAAVSSTVARGASPTGGGGAAAAGTPAATSRAPSWGSSTPATAPRYGSGGGGATASGGSAAAAAALLTSSGGAPTSEHPSRPVSQNNTSSPSPSPSPSPPLVSPRGAGTVSKYARARLPPAEEWRGVAAAAASAGVSRAANQQLQAPPPPAPPPLQAPPRRQQQQQQQHARQPSPPPAAWPAAGSRAEVAMGRVSGGGGGSGGGKVATSPGRWATPGPAAGAYGGRASNPSPSPIRTSPAPHRAASPARVPAAGAAAMPAGRVRTPLRQQSMVVSGSLRDVGVAGSTPGRVSDSGRGVGAGAGGRGIMAGSPGRVPREAAGGSRGPSQSGAGGVLAPQPPPAAARGSSASPWLQARGTSSRG